MTNQPHVRGENWLLFSEMISFRESTPRTWGEHAVKPTASKIFRINPTHVGRTPVSSGLLLSSRNQPHARGENTNKVLYIKGSKTIRFHFSFIFATFYLYVANSSVNTYYYTSTYPLRCLIILAFFRNLSNSQSIGKSWVIIHKTGTRPRSVAHI